MHGFAEMNGGGRERASQVPALHFKMCYLEPKSAFFGPKPRRNLLKTAKCKVSHLKKGAQSLKFLTTHGLTPQKRCPDPEISNC